MENIQIHILNALNSVEVPRLSKTTSSLFRTCVSFTMVQSADRLDLRDQHGPIICYCKISWLKFKILKLIFCKNEKSGMSKCVKLNYTNSSHTCHCSK